MPQCSHALPASFCVRPEWAITKLVSSSLMGMWLLTGSPSFCAAHCSQRCFSIFLPLLISVRWTVAGLLQLSHFMKDRRGQRSEEKPVCRSTPETSRNRISAAVQRQTPSGVPQGRALRAVDGRILVRLPHFDTLEPHAVRQPPG